jgi:hypothetical protein
VCLLGSNKAAEGGLTNLAAKAAGAGRKQTAPVTPHWHEAGCISPLVELGSIEKLWSACL